MYRNVSSYSGMQKLKKLYHSLLQIPSRWPLPPVKHWSGWRGPWSLRKFAFINILGLWSFKKYPYVVQKCSPALLIVFSCNLWLHSSSQCFVQTLRVSSKAYKLSLKYNVSHVTVLYVLDAFHGSSFNDDGYPAGSQWGWPLVNIST